MDNTIRDLATWYPFVPASGELPEAVTKIVDLRIVLVLDAKNIVDIGENGVDLAAHLISISGSFAIFRIQSNIPLAGTHDMTVQVPVLIGRYSECATGSYVVVTEAVSFTGDLLVHPECLVALQRPPTITFMCRNNINSEEQSSSEDVNDSTEIYNGPFAFASGNNVTARVTGDEIRFDGAGGAGRGVYTVPPYTDVSAYVTGPPIGMRSINGATGAVNIVGDNDVYVSVTETVPGQLTLSIRPRVDTDEISIDNSVISNNTYNP